jgi:hypothetical protein
MQKAYTLAYTLKYWPTYQALVLQRYPSIENIHFLKQSLYRKDVNEYTF